MPARRRRNFRVEVLEDRVNPVTMFALTDANTLLTFDSATPGTIVNNVGITGLVATEKIVGIDTRPATGQLYAMGLVDDGATRTARTYTIDPATGAATLVGGGPWTNAYPDADFGGFDFNPNVDRIRVISRETNNFRVNPNNGALAGTDTNTSTDGLNGVAYTNNDGFAQTTTLYGLDFDTDDLVTVGGLNGVPSPNGGQVNVVGDTGIVAAFAYGMEIVSSNGVATAFATAGVGGATNLYTANLATGALTAVGAIGGNPNILSLTSALSTITVAGTTGNDTLVVNATGTASGTYTLNGGTPVPFANIESFSFLAGGGDDQLQINNPAGGVFAPANGIIFHGGGGTGNTLVNSGGQSFAGHFLPANATDGSLLHDAQSVAFTGLSAVTDTVPTANFQVMATAAADAIGVANGPAAGLLQVNAGATPTFPTLNFANKPSVQLKADEGDNTVTLNVTDATAGLNTLFVMGGSTADTFLVQSTAATTILSAGDGDDVIRFADGATLSGGAADGMGGTDTLDYSAYTTPVAVNLGLGVAGLSAALNGSQEVPSNGSTATGTATLSNYDVASKTFDLTLTVAGVAAADVTGLHLHRGGLGVNGPVILDLLDIGTLVPSIDGFTLTLIGVDLNDALPGGAGNEAAFLGGQTYLNVHTSAFPGGVIRGQVFSTANVLLTTGTATGTGGVSNVENVTGGSAADSLIGNGLANALSGLGGNDTILGGPGADTFLGGADDDTMIWSNGDGSDVMNGDAGTDTVAVNGSLTADDVFTINANAARVAFARTSPGPFTLDIGTTEALRVNGGAAGKDSFTAGNLTGVANLTTVDLFGLAGDDTFDVTPSAVAFALNGGTGADDPTIQDGGEADAFLTVAADPAGGVAGGFTFSNRGAVAFSQVELPFEPFNFLTVTNAVSRTSAAPGTVLTYTITVTNNAEGGITGITVSAPFSPLSNVTWTAAFTGTGSTGAASGTGVIDELVSLAAGGTVTYTVTGTIPAAAGTTVSVSAAALVPTPLTDSNPADNAAAATTDVVRIPTQLIVTGPPGGNGLVFTPQGGQYGAVSQTNVLFADFAGELHVAQGDVTGDGFFDVAVGTGPGAATVRVIRQDATVLADLTPFPGYTGGVFVAVGDLDGDGLAEVAVTPDAVDAFSGPVNRELPVRVYSGASIVAGTPTLLASFNGLAGLDGASGEADGTKLGGRPSIADTDGDGLLDLLIAAGNGGGPRITIWNGTGFAGAAGGKPTTNPISNLFVFESSQRGGAFLAAGDITGDGVAEIIVGGGPGGGPRVRIVDGAKLFSLPNQGVNLDDPENLANGLVLNNFFAGDINSRGGLRVAVTDVDGDGRADVVTGSGTGEPAFVNVYTAAGLETAFGKNADPVLLQGFAPFPGVQPSGVYVG